MRLSLKILFALLAFSLVAVGCDAPTSAVNDSENIESATATTNAGHKGPGATPPGRQDHAKATGDVTWAAQDGDVPGLKSEFDVHEDAPGNTSSYGDRGTHHISRPADGDFSGGSLKLDVKCVNVEDTEAWFAGTVASGQGEWSNLKGEVFLYWVKDNGTPGAAGPDMIGGTGTYSALDKACTAVANGSWTGTGLVTDGNLVVHN